MISNRTIQECVDDINEIMHTSLAVFETEGQLVAGNLEATDKIVDGIEYFLESPADSQQMSGYHFFKVYEAEDVLCIVVADAGSAQGYSAGNLAVRQLGQLAEAYKERFSINQFMQDVLLDRLLPADVYNRAKQLGVEANERRAVFLIEAEHKQDEVVLEMLRELYGKSRHTCVTAVDEDNIVLIKEMNEEDTCQSVAKLLVDMINVEAMSKVRVSYGNIVAEVRELSKAYREAKMAMEVGNIFYSGRTVVAYDMLGIGRLIYQLPTELCDMFLTEVFGGSMTEKIDEELLVTINKFMEMNLNLSETARQLYIHRNTLAYRLEKIEKETGLDIRSFEDAMTLKLALMVADYRRATGGPVA